MDTNAGVGVNHEWTRGGDWFEPRIDTNDGGMNVWGGAVLQVL